MLLWSQAPLLGPNRRALSCEDDCCWEQLVWRIWMLKHVNWEDISQSVRRDFAMAFGFLASCQPWPGDQSDGHRAAGRWWQHFLHCLLSFHCRLQRSPRLLVCVQDFLHFLNLHMQLISLVKRRACLCLPLHTHTCSLFSLTHSNWHFVPISLKHFLTKGIIMKKTLTKQKSKKIPNAILVDCFGTVAKRNQCWAWESCKILSRVFISRREVTHTEFGHSDTVQSPNGKKKKSCFSLGVLDCLQMCNSA